MLPHLAKGYLVMGPSEVDSETPQRENETGRGYKVPNGAMYTTVGDASYLKHGSSPATGLEEVMGGLSAKRNLSAHC